MNDEAPNSVLNALSENMIYYNFPSTPPSSPERDREGAEGGRESVGPLHSRLLHDAARSGNTRDARYIVQICGADLNAKDENGDTALHLAAEEGHAETVRALVALGAVADGRAGECGWTPLHLAASEVRQMVSTYL